ncbi:indolepyruvate ferredoxin oxidoreductase family protein [Mycolicibacterium komossense]|uniref:Indolepyruvate ferredoxin oxidoreductase family protein n=1 Tax=Mycolicibacterium komossense TaxID=1779 RepID=A0ABT3CF82_9MYCO|nr:indolepyruvate ferredoxin oxidoreductase family protein [Mycolicibacterium komossense]MCV7228135.1 indolepyruvate ferredoxin oxidoreductase family protein [Mycolicibacterium komossense]
MTDVHEPSARKIDLADRYVPASGPVLLTGVQAIARLLAEQNEHDRRAGRRVATFVSGYQGSPLAGLDRLLARLPNLAGDHDVRLVPGMNEELAATAVWGSQLELPKGARTHDGVLGVWYGKGPGLDRASDSLRHANMYGAHPRGGALVLVGDDPAAKSSSVPCASEMSLAAMGMPVLYPRNADELIRFGLYGVAMSRLSGCWVSMKIVADVADGLWTIDGDYGDVDITTPSIDWEGRPWTYRQRVLASPPDSVLAEADLYGPRWAMVQAFGATNEFDRIEVDPAHACMGIIAVGSAYDAVRETLTELGLDESGLLRSGIRILRVGMPFPLSANAVRRLAAGVKQVVVVEDKTSFVERQVKDILYGAGAPPVLGKQDLGGRRLIPPDGQLTSARLQAPLRRALRGFADLAAPPPPRLELTALPAKRTPYFCSGCPHNRSTAVPDGSLAGGGIGCHTLVTMSSRTDSQVTGLTQMGGEGAQWIGQSAFTDVDHIFQNIGDGTYFHSGQLAVQACVAAGVNITYKILYNSAVAMTGGQDAEAGLTVPQLTHKLTADGVAAIIVCSEDPHRHPARAFAPGVAVWHRDRLDEAQRHLREVPGVTVLIYDQQCAAEARRLRKRGTQPTPRTRVVINEAVCEGCGDCGVKSNCLSVQPVDTEFGRKTRIDQTSCNTDYSCLDGECPSFITVELPENPQRAEISAPTPPELEHPTIVRITGKHNIFLAGIGGTGIVTVNQVLGMAALRAGLHVEGLDQTGLSQKAGPVTSHLRLAASPVEGANRVGDSGAHCILAFDLMTAADPGNARYGDPETTVTIASRSATPTGEMVYDPSVSYPDEAALLHRLGVVSGQLVVMDALAAAQTLFGSTAAANFLLVGAAYQAGGLPIPASAINEAIALNGVAVKANQAAFAWGRAAVAAPETFADATTRATTTARSDDQLPPGLLDGLTIAEPTSTLVHRRAAQLVAYQNESTAKRYLLMMQQVWDAERRVGDATDFSAAVAHGLHRLMAYKDEYEVARLLTDPAFLAAVQSEVPGSENLTYKLHPPTLKALGREKKIGFGPHSHAVLRTLAHGKWLRGTRFDPFGYSRMRRLERRLAAHYEQMIRQLCGELSAETYRRATAGAEAADLVRGYEDVKLRNVDKYVMRLRELGLPAPAPLD